MQKNDVLLVNELDTDCLMDLLSRYHLTLELLADDQKIPGSFWGDSEAGLIGSSIYVHPTTPAHSLLHEACHYICMPAQRRQQLDTDAGGDYDEENAVCYLQILLADHLPPLNPERMMADMDKWGYSFRLGSASRWFQEDAEDARQWLLAQQLIDKSSKPTWQLRQ